MSNILVSVLKNIDIVLLSEATLASVKHAISRNTAITRTLGKPTAQKAVV
jgi:hypothetical protein